MAGVFTGKGEIEVTMGILYTRQVAYDCVQCYIGMLGCRLACFCDGGRVVRHLSYASGICVGIIFDIDAMAFLT